MLSEVLSGIVSLHEAVVLHSAVSTRIVYFLIHCGLLHGRAKLDLARLFEAAIVPPQVSQLSIRELMLRPPETLYVNSPDGIQFFSLCPRTCSY